MKFLVDAQLPVRLAQFLGSAGHDVLHTRGLPDGNRTADWRIAELADDEDRVVVTKDRDFRDSHLLSRSPRRLLIVATGNITNAALLSLFEVHLDAILAALEESDFAEFTPSSLIVHRRREGGPAVDL